MDYDKIKCPFCNSDAAMSESNGRRQFYECPVCGRYEIVQPVDFFGFNPNHLAAFLLYHAFSESNDAEYKYHSVLNKENDDCSVYIDAQMVENWYPKIFADRIDQILLYFGNHIPHLGQSVDFSFEELCSIFFIDRWEYNQKWIIRNEDDYSSEVDYITNYMTEQEFISFSQYYPEGSTAAYSISIKPKGYARVDELQKNTSHGRSVLVAMSFQHTETLREAIRKGIQDAGYVATFIDEVPHNNFITPELLKHIRDSKFVVVDLTHQNNGAYFEEGYAMGLGKSVIQLCQKDTKLHFDIAQKNTIIWETEEEIPERLKNRILATIE